jgi:hypothetical protein
VSFAEICNEAHIFPDDITDRLCNRANLEIPLLAAPLRLAAAMAAEAAEEM